MAEKLTEQLKDVRAQLFHMTLCRDELAAQLEQAEAALAKAQGDTVETIKFYDGALAKEKEERHKYLQLAATRQVERDSAAETIRGLHEALEKIKKRALQDSPEDVEAEVASGRTINDMYVLAKAALAAQLDAGVGAADRRERVRRITAKCEQYWNEPVVGEAEFHAILEFIHREATGILWDQAPHA